MLRPSDRIVRFIKTFEQLRLRAYKPTPADRWTCGWGSTGSDVGPNTVWSVPQAEARFRRDLDSFAGGVRNLLDEAATSQHQFDALVSFAYNCGLDIDDDRLAEGLGDSTLLRKHRRGDYPGAAAEFTKWNRQNGVVLRGLTRRRVAEAAIYLGGD